MLKCRSQIRYGGQDECRYRIALAQRRETTRGVCEVAWCLATFRVLNNTFSDKNYQIDWKDGESLLVKTFPNALL
jgi:hypothetical protein